MSNATDSGYKKVADGKIVLLLLQVLNDNVSCFLRFLGKKSEFKGMHKTKTATTVGTGSTRTERTEQNS